MRLTYRVNPSPGVLAIGPEAAARMDPEISATLVEIGGLGHQMVTTFTPHGATGALRGSRFTELRGSPLQRTQIIAGRLVYDPIVEVGRRPGTMPPPRALERWVSRRLGVPKHSVAAVAFLVARKIGRRGSAGHQMYRRTAARLRPIVARKASELATRLARVIIGGA